MTHFVELLEKLHQKGIKGENLAIPCSADIKDSRTIRCHVKLAYQTNISLSSDGTRKRNCGTTVGDIQRVFKAICDTIRLKKS